MKSVKILVASLLLTLAGGVSAYGAYGTPFTYAQVSWAFAANISPLNSCNEVLLDLTGLQVYPINDIVYGNIKCPAIGGQYGAFGSAYVSGGLFHMGLTFANGWIVRCINLPEATLSGPCTVYDGLGVQRGSAYIVFGG